MKFKVYLTFLFFILCQKIDAQTFQATYGGANSDVMNGSLQTVDGGYIMVGYTSSYGAGNNDVYLVKINSIGGILWSKTFGGTNNDRGFSIAITNDGGYIIAGTTNSFGTSNLDIYLIKTDGNGLLEWSKTYCGPLDEETNTVLQTSDGGYAITGSTNSFSAGGDRDSYLLKTDSSGTLLWCRTYGSALYENVSDMEQTIDNGYIISGISNSSGNYRPSVIKMDSIGTIQWHKTYNGYGVNYSSGVEITNDGGYIICGSENNIQCYGFIWKTDSFGTVVWSKMGGRRIREIKKTNDQGFVFTLESGVIIGASGSWLLWKYTTSLLKTDSIGNYQWSKTYGGSATTYGIIDGIVAYQTNDNGYAFLGRLNDDAFLIKTDSIGNSGCVENSDSYNMSNDSVSEIVTPVFISAIAPIIVDTALTITDSGGVANMLCYTGIENNIIEKEKTTIYPNPTTGKFNFLNSDNNSTIRIYDCIGKLVLQTNIKDSEQTIDISNEEKGIYFYRLENKKGEITSGKIILQ